MCVGGPSSSKTCGPDVSLGAHVDLSQNACRMVVAAILVGHGEDALPGQHTVMRNHPDASCCFIREFE
jgi:hypothetical protein